MSWYERASKISETKLNMAFLGKILVILSLGSMFSRQLIPYGYWILIAATLITINFLSGYIPIFFKKKPMKKRTMLYAYIGGYLLLLFFGMQTTQLPFKPYIILIGVLLTIPALIEFFKVK